MMCQLVVEKENHPKKGKRPKKESQPKKENHLKKGKRPKNKALILILIGVKILIS